MNRQISLITTATSDLDAAARLYEDGFGWEPAFATPEIRFNQMAGFVFAVFAQDPFAADMNRPVTAGPGPFSLAHNVAGEGEVVPFMDRLIAAGGTLLRAADRPPYGGLRGDLSGPDGVAWEIAYQPGFELLPDGGVRLAI